VANDHSTYDADYVPYRDLHDWVSTRIEEGVWDRYAQRLREARLDSAGPETKGEVVKSLLAAAVNTGAIEGLHNADRGLTLTVVEHAVDWEKHVRAAEGEDAEAHVRAGLEAFDMALDAATKYQEISEVWIRQLHEVACAAQDAAIVVTPVGMQSQTFAKGHYKALPNHVEQVDGSIHAYAPVDEVPIQMRRLVESMRSPSFDGAHPVIQTAFVHHAFTNVHPFQDGNGRVARALASVFLLRAASIPLVIYPDQSVSYFDALEKADDGNLQPFVDFIFDRSVDMLAFSADLSAGSGPLRAIMPRDRTPANVVEAARRLSSLVEREIRKKIDSVEVSDGIEVRASTMGFTPGARDEAGRRTVTDQHPMAEVVVSEYGLSLNRWFAVFAGVEDGMRFPIALCREAREDCVEFRLEEVHPEVTTAATLKLSAYVQRVLAELFQELNDELERR